MLLPVCHVISSCNFLVASIGHMAFQLQPNTNQLTSKKTKYLSMFTYCHLLFNHQWLNFYRPLQS